MESKLLHVILDHMVKVNPPPWRIRILHNATYVVSQANKVLVAVNDETEGRAICVAALKASQSQHEWQGAQKEENGIPDSL